jgi:hypothetical protein
VREVLTTVLEVVSALVIVVGVAFVLGIGAALVALGAVGLVFSWALEGAPLPKRKSGAA